MKLQTRIYRERKGLIFSLKSEQECIEAELDFLGMEKQKKILKEIFKDESRIQVIHLMRQGQLYICTYRRTYIFS